MGCEYSIEHSCSNIDEKSLALFYSFQNFKFEKKFGKSLADFFEMGPHEIQMIFMMMYEFFLKSHDIKGIFILMPYIDREIFATEYEYLDEIFEESLKLVFDLQPKKIEYFVKKRLTYLQNELQPHDNCKYWRVRL